jgi:hypothetical protein
MLVAIPTIAMRQRSQCTHLDEQKLSYGSANTRFTHVVHIYIEHIGWLDK